MTDNKIWVLETQTKGTGANVVPLERVQRKGRSDAVPGFAFPPRREKVPEQPGPPPAHRFRVIDVMTRQLLAEDVDARQAVAALEEVRSIVDVTVSAWDHDAERWRMLTFAETQALWEFRGRLAASEESG